MGCITPKNQVNSRHSMQVLPDQNFKPSSLLSTIYSKRNSSPHLPKPVQSQPLTQSRSSSFSIPNMNLSRPPVAPKSESSFKSSPSPKPPNNPKESGMKSIKLPQSWRSSLKDETPNTENSQSQLLNIESRFFCLCRSGNLNKQKLDNGEYLINQYKIVGNLGRGTYGKVLKAVDENGQVFAITIYNKRLLRTRWIGKSKNALAQVLDEIEILAGIDVQGVVRIVEVIEQPFYHKFYVVKEFFCGGPLAGRIPFEDRLREKFEKEADRVWRVMKEFFDLNRDDVKVENFLIDDEDNLMFKGFGSSLKIKEDQKVLRSSVSN